MQTVIKSPKERIEEEVTRITKGPVTFVHVSEVLELAALAKQLLEEKDVSR